MNVRSFVARTRLNVSDGLNAAKSFDVANVKNRITLIGLCACGTYVYSFPSVQPKEEKHKFSISHLDSPPTMCQCMWVATLHNGGDKGKTIFATFVRGDTSLRTTCIGTSGHGLVFVWSAHLVHIFDIYPLQTLHWARILLFRNVNRLSLPDACVCSTPKTNEWRWGGKEK